MRVKRSVSTFTERYQVLAVAFSDAGDQVYTAGIENLVKVWDLRKEAVVMELKVRRWVMVRVGVPRTQ